VQHLVPVPGLPWLAVLTVTTPNQELAGTYADLADLVAASLEVLDPSGRSAGRRATKRDERPHAVLTGRNPADAGECAS